MAETTTTLNPGTGGDKMDESRITQTDGVTLANRPNVVIGGSSGRDSDGVNDLVLPVKAEPAVSSYALPALGVAVVSDAPRSYVEAELRALSLNTEGRLRVSTMPARQSEQTVDDSQASMWDAAHIGGPASPWGTW